MQISRPASMIRQDGVLSTFCKAMCFISSRLERRFANVYRQYIRKTLPEVGRRTFNSVDVFGEKKLFDEYLPYRYHYPDAPGKGVVRPNYENGIVIAHEKYTNENDSVIIIGGGIGVTAVRAAQIAGRNGSVRVFEGGEESVKNIRHVLELNGVSEWCRVMHQIVGQPHNVYAGGIDQSKLQHPSRMSNCDVLELDCEGSELEIIQEMEIRPRVLLIELHPWAWDQRPEAIVDELKSKGYNIDYKADHDGTPLESEDFQRLLLDSNNQEHKRANPDLDWPVIITAIRES